jgi:hypothetical protein
MSCPQLFQQAEPNIGGHVTIVSFQDQDREKVIARQSSLADEIRQILADHQARNVFLNEADGLWGGSITKSKNGSIKLSSGSNEDAQYTSHINSILNSPPKKGILNLPKWGGGYLIPLYQILLLLLTLLKLSITLGLYHKQSYFVSEPIHSHLLMKFFYRPFDIKTLLDGLTSFEVTRPFIGSNCMIILIYLHENPDMIPGQLN